MNPETFNCPFCFERSLEIRYDKKRGNPYLFCWRCNSRAFVRSAQNLGAIAFISEIIENGRLSGMLDKMKNFVEQFVYARMNVSRLPAGVENVEDLPVSALGRDVEKERTK